MSTGQDSMDATGRFDILEHLAGRKRRAKERLDATKGGQRLYVALLGVETGAHPLELEGVCSLRKVEDAPNEIELAGVLKSKALLATVSRYTPTMRYELQVETTDGGDINDMLSVAWSVIVALRIRVDSDFLAVAASTVSWSAMSAAPEHSVMVTMLEDFPRARSIADKSPICQADMDWVAANLTSLGECIGTPRFRLSVDCLTTHFHEASLRMTTASLWAGVEAVFSINSELSFRVAAYMATYLESRGPDRLKLFKQVKALYAFR